MAGRRLNKKCPPPFPAELEAAPLRGSPDHEHPANAEPIFERRCRVFLDPRPGGLGGFDGFFKTTVCVNSRV